MADKPKRASEYTSEQAELVRAVCLYVATKLGDMMDDLLIIGGLVPSLIVDQEDLPEGADGHVGTMDLDVGLQPALLDEGRYRKLTERLRDAGFRMDTNADGNPTRQRWAITNAGTVTVDFLIPPSRSGDRGGKLRHIEPDFAAVIAPGLRSAFRARKQVTLEGRTIFGEKAKRDNSYGCSWTTMKPRGPSRCFVAISRTPRQWGPGGWRSSSPEDLTTRSRLTWWVSLLSCWNRLKSSLAEAFDHRAETAADWQSSYRHLRGIPVPPGCLNDLRLRDMR